jgi:hypothetical protein
LTCCCFLSAVRIMVTIWRQHDACPILQTESVGPITNSDLISKVFNGSTSILMSELLKFGYSVRRCGADGPTCMLVILYGYPTGPEPNMPVKHPRMAHDFFPERFSNNGQGLRCTFFWDLHKIWCTLAVPLLVSSRNRTTKKITMSTQLCEIVYTDSQDMLVLSSTVALCYYNCCTDSSTNPGNYGYHLAFLTLFSWKRLATLALTELKNQLPWFFMTVRTLHKPNWHLKTLTHFHNCICSIATIMTTMPWFSEH